MNRASGAPTFVGNDFVLPARPRLQPAAPLPAPASIITISEPLPVAIPISVTISKSQRLPRINDFCSEAWDYVHRYALGSFAILFLAVGVAGTHLGDNYLTAQAIAAQVSAPVKPVVSRNVGQNMIFKSSELEQQLQAVAAQPISFTVGDQAVQISPETIKSWVKTSPGPKSTSTKIHVDQAAITATLTELSGKHVKTPLNQVATTHDGVTTVIAQGRNGVKLSDPEGLKRQASEAAKTLMHARGLQFSAPTETEAFASVTPAAFPKMIEVNINTKQMYLYENGSIVKTYPISAGAAETPTPVGQYKIKSKLTIQDMWGYNPNGTKYFQPNVRWISYFENGGYAIHGNYWRPASWFGAINSSHGCVSLPDAQAKEVYDWSPVGTTIITHT